ncbi:MAG: phosphoglycerate kinase [Saprospiraceae bacterium]|nr:phosphoglycerate kinase [Saprospiraceae bacterium]
MQKLNFEGEKVLLRVDFNVPMDAQHHITDDTRIVAALPTINYILDHGGAVILMSHLGRPLKKLLPDGNIDTEQFSLKHLVKPLEKLTKTTVQFVSDCLSNDAAEAAKALKSGEILLLENTRFHKGEEKGELDMARKLASLGSVYVNDAFGTAHRAHASTAVIASLFPASKRGFGMLMQAELDNATRVLDHPAKPLLAIVGGAKVSDKILLLDNLLDKVDALIIGGGMAFTFIRAQGGNTGNSIVEEDRLDLALQLIEKAKEKNIELLLPEDAVIADKFDTNARIQTINSHQIPDGWMGLDIGPKASHAFSSLILKAKTILWNGPMGVFEMAPFASGTKAIAHAIAQATEHGAFSLVGGGDSVTAINQMGLADSVSFVSTGGGALLELLEGKKLPGITAILT